MKYSGENNFFAEICTHVTFQHHRASDEEKHRDRRPKISLHWHFCRKQRMFCFPGLPRVSERSIHAQKVPGKTRTVPSRKACALVFSIMFSLGHNHFLHELFLVTLGHPAPQQGRTWSGTGIFVAQTREPRDTHADTTTYNLPYLEDLSTRQRKLVHYTMSALLPPPRPPSCCCLTRLDGTRRCTPLLSSFIVIDHTHLKQRLPYSFEHVFFEQHAQHDG